MFKPAYTAALVMFLLQAGVSAAAGDELKSVHVRGSTTLLPLAQRIAEMYLVEQPGTTVAVSGGSTGRGYKDVMDGTADVGLASGPLSPAIQREMDRRGVKLVVVTAAYNAIVPVVHPSNPLNGLTTQQLRNIFTGRINNWKDLGGKNAPIRVYLGPPSGGITEAWKAAIIGDEGTYTPKGVVLTTEPRLQRVAADPLAITYFAFGGMNRSVKPLRVNDIAASADTVADGRYPLRSPLMLVTTDRPSTAARDFVQYFTAPGKHLDFAGIVSVKAANE